MTQGKSLARCLAQSKPLSMVDIGTNIIQGLSLALNTSLTE